jgi:hypothetical protein
MSDVTEGKWCDNFVFRGQQSALVKAKWFHDLSVRQWQQMQNDDRRRTLGRGDPLGSKQSRRKESPGRTVSMTEE